MAIVVSKNERTAKIAKSRRKRNTCGQKVNHQLNEGEGGIEPEGRDGPSCERTVSDHHVVIIAYAACRDQLVPRDASH